ncbi:predicted protein [Verticillium alfalfae VaMs.102]|uniref:Predicted protein n=1 Tax=Verticillium alfalfae (strain VaMs.102 / ATCC MYA-4576 / FGSC 10136) TaxID=526221 RepID=C9SWE8_VERA1|nr:predicted protein [Verticillium alfalfae VaMs.102]EEY23113.1 predicted protein [Verticillium alfalfae VaMs.102]
MGRTLAYTTVKFFNKKGELAARGSHTNQGDEETDSSEVLPSATTSACKRADYHQAHGTDEKQRGDCDQHAVSCDAVAAALALSWNDKRARSRVIIHGPVGIDSKPKLRDGQNNEERGKAIHDEPCETGMASVATRLRDLDGEEEFPNSANE